MNPEIRFLVWGFVLGHVASVLLLLVAWRGFKLRRQEEFEELRKNLKENLENLFQDKPLRTLRRRSRESGEIASLLDESLPVLRTQNAESRRQVRQLRVVLESMTEGVVAIDSRLRVILANPAAQPLLGIEESSLGRLLPETIRNPKLLAIAHDSVENARAYEAQLNLNTRDHVGRIQSRVIEVRIAPILRRPDTERPQLKPSAAGAVLVVQDVTELRRLERMRQDFVTNASHELKTPLASMKLYTESLLEWALDDPEHNRDFLLRIEEQADRLTNLVSDMLSLSRLESGQELFRHVPSAIVPLLRARVSSYLDRAASKDIALELEMKITPESLQVLAAEEAIRQILDNLIDNAVKYTHSGGRVQVEATMAGPQWVEITVSDTGLGIPKADLDRIFERFYRVDKARSRDVGGTGLGLSIVKHIVGSIGGEIRVESREGYGSQFRFTLPVVAEPSPET